MERAPRILRFGAVGVAATALYAVLAWLGSQALGLGAVAASLAAYACSGVFSYLGQKHLTFRSAGADRGEAPRFGLLALAGWGVAAAAPALLSGSLGLPVAVPIAVTCLLVPALNYLAMERLVFTGGGR